ncbi:hypothetical protein BIY24_07175 [Halobacteriovorax marinus]|uniref:Uracil-DNA glycosylase n=1 Tax=Halobacteriovorax marinus (strain ATCC BAA-682 / DSM 15412 / SJ) TaxID=862908 RepID=E1X0P1_HALMS|nr:hypothetical protein [Halobacteriovorax marinus]ATH07733.1 hypothetical protein BIY24_07175 [Halobacteriovorax marinus]CBW26379.1 hypothetical protein BMS_1524 [Halobacteriovorax marinus SJ]
MSDKPACLKCVHYKASWDPKNPRACKLYGFSSKFLPSQVVKRETGTECQGFKMKDHFKKSKPLDLNDESLW